MSSEATRCKSAAWTIYWQTPDKHSKEQGERRQDELATAIFNALSRPDETFVPSETITFAGTDIASNGIYTSITSVLTSSEALIKEYKRLDDIVTDLRNQQAEPVSDKWTRNIEGTEEQLKMGARVAVRNVKKVLGADVEGEGDEDGDVEMMDSESVERLELNYELHKSISYAERGVKRMVKGLPQEEA